MHAEPRRALSDLGTRVLSAAVFGPCFVILAWRGSAYFVLLVNLLALVGTWEFLRLASARGLRPFRLLGYASAAIVPWWCYLDAGVHALPVVTLLVVVALAWAAFRGDIQGALLDLGATLLGVVYVVWLFSHLVLLRELPGRLALAEEVGFKLVLLTFVLVWVSDTGAYLVGSLFGRHKMAPHISPGKSIEGGVGALLLSGLAGLAVAATFLNGVLTPLSGVVLGVLGSLVGQIGDLIESMLKRDARIKDASNVIPGHGGVLDRFDSVLFVGPLVYYALRFFIL